MGMVRGSPTSQDFPALRCENAFLQHVLKVGSVFALASPVGRVFTTAGRRKITIRRQRSQCAALTEQSTKESARQRTLGMELKGNSKQEKKRDGRRLFGCTTLIPQGPYPIADTKQQSR